MDRAIEMVERALALHGAPIYVRHEVVHNKFVVDGLRQKGAIFIEDLADVPSGSILIFSAHGVSQAVRHEAEARGLTVFDATCPLVTKVHIEVSRMREQGKEIVMIGHAGHPEVEGTMGQYEGGGKGGMYLVESPEQVLNLKVNDEKNLAYVTQTTLSVDDASTIATLMPAIWLITCIGLPSIRPTAVAFPEPSLKMGLIKFVASTPVINAPIVPPTPWMPKTSSVSS